MPRVVGGLAKKTYKGGGANIWNVKFVESTDMPYKINVKVIKQEGRCIAGHKVGDEFIFDGPNLPNYFCPDALAAAYPRIFAAFFNAKVPWIGSDKFACPDPVSPVVFEATRVGLSTWDYFYDLQMKIVDIVNRNPGINAAGISDKFSEEDKKYYRLTPERIQIYINELLETGYLEMKDQELCAPLKPDRYNCYYGKGVCAIKRK